MGENRCLDLQTLSPDRRRAIIRRENCTVGWRSPQTPALSNTHTHTPRQTHTHTHTSCTPFPQPPPTPPRRVRAQPTEVSARSVGVHEGIDRPRHNTRSMVHKCQTPIHSPPPSLQIHEGTSYRTWRREIPKSSSLVQNRQQKVQPVPERVDDEHRGVTEPTSSALFLHMKVDHRAAGRKKKNKKRCSPLFS